MALTDVEGACQGPSPYKPTNTGNSETTTPAAPIQKLSKSVSLTRGWDSVAPFSL